MAHTFSRTPEMYMLLKNKQRNENRFVSCTVCVVRAKMEWSICGINQSFCSADNAYTNVLRKSQICRQNFNFSNIMVLKAISRLSICFNREIRKLFPFTLFFILSLSLPSVFPQVFPCYCCALLCIHILFSTCHHTTHHAQYKGREG